MNAVDTNVLLYSVDRNEPAKQLAVQELLRQLRSAAEPTLLLWQVLGELAQQLRRWRDQGRLSPAEFSQHVQAFRHLFPLALPTADAFDSAMGLAERFSLSHWDSMPRRRCDAPLHRRHGRAANDRRNRVDQPLRLMAGKGRRPGLHSVAAPRWKLCHGFSFPITAVRRARAAAASPPSAAGMARSSQGSFCRS